MVMREVWLDEDQDRRLADVAGRKGMTPAELINAVVADLLRGSSEPADDHDAALGLLEADLDARAGEALPAEIPWRFVREDTYE